MPANSDRPWMTALEMQFSALAVVRKLTRMAGVPPSVTDDHVLDFLPRSAPFNWTADITSAVWTASETIPETASFDRDLLPEGLTSAWWWFSWPLPVPMKYPEQPHETAFPEVDWDHLCALLLSLDVDGVWLISCGRLGRNMPFMVESNRMRSGTSLHDLLRPDGLQYDVQRKRDGPIAPRDIQLFRFVLGASVWLKQRIAVTSEGHIERHRRKQLARDFGVEVPSDVKVIQLRRTESSPRTETPAGEPVEWSCRWLVSGHWRNQYHPSDGKHELQYILPYVKGPDDKPLRIPSHTVYTVTR